MELKSLSPVKYPNLYVLLIVPYGIEMRKVVGKVKPSTLLIVPYGIEITARRSSQKEQISF